MIPNDQPLRGQMIERMICDLLVSIEVTEGRHTKWECDFIRSINDQFENKGDLSNKQCEILERIYDK